MRLKHESTQWEFVFCNALPIVRQAVLSLRRYCRGRWDAKVHEVSYSDWLEFYTPLCSRGGVEDPGALGDGEDWISYAGGKGWLTALKDGILRTGGAK